VSRWKDAVKRLEEAGADPARAWLTWPALALAHHRAGDKARARKWLAKADEWSSGKARQLGGGPHGSWRGGEWADFQILYREARSLIRGEAR
jgi:hypothetical protein